MVEVDRPGPLRFLKRTKLKAAPTPEANSFSIAARDRLERAGVAESSQIIDDLVAHIVNGEPGIDTLTLYSRAADVFPLKLSKKKQLEALGAMGSTDPDVRDAGKKVLFFMNLKSILSALQPYVSQYPHLGEDLFQEAVTLLLEKLPSLTPRHAIPAYFNNRTRGAAISMVASEENMMPGWIRNGTAVAVRQMIDNVIRGAAASSALTRVELVDMIVAKTRLPETSIDSYVNSRFYLFDLAADMERMDEDSIVWMIDRSRMSQRIEAICQAVLDGRDNRIFHLRYGEGLQLEQTAKEVSEEGKDPLSRERIRQISEGALLQVRKKYELMAAGSNTKAVTPTAAAISSETARLPIPEADFLLLCQAGKTYISQIVTTSDEELAELGLSDNSINWLRIALLGYLEKETESLRDAP